MVEFTVVFELLENYRTHNNIDNIKKLIELIFTKKLNQIKRNMKDRSTILSLEKMNIIASKDPLIGKVGFEIHDESVFELLKQGFFKEIIRDCLNSNSDCIKMIVSYQEGIGLQDNGAAPYFYAKDVNIFFKEVVEKIWGFKLSGEQKERVEIYLIKNLNVPIGKAEIWWEYILHNHTKAFDLFNYIKVLSKDVN